MCKTFSFTARTLGSDLLMWKKSDKEIDKERYIELLKNSDQNLSIDEISKLSWKELAERVSNDPHYLPIIAYEKQSRKKKE